MGGGRRGGVIAGSEHLHGLRGRIHCGVGGAFHVGRESSQCLGGTIGRRW